MVIKDKFYGDFFVCLVLLILLSSKIWIRIKLNSLNVHVLYGNSMERILERYERYSYAERQLLANDDPENHVCHLSNCFFNL